MTRKRWLWTGGLLVLLPAAAAAWWLGSPLLIDRVVEEQFPLAAPASVPEGITRAEGEAKVEEAAAEIWEAQQALPAPSQEAVLLKEGRLRDADSFHQGSGRVAIYRLDDQGLVLRLEDLQVTNGPDLHVILTPHPDPRTSEDVHAAGYVDLGKLKGNLGNQTYEIAADTDIEAQASLVIYCQPFHVLFSIASLAEPET